MTFLIRILWLLSVLGFLIVLFASYKNLQPVILFGSGDGMSSQGMDKNVYFYVVVGIFLLFNILFNILIKSIPLIPNHLLVIPNKRFWMQDHDNQRSLYDFIKRWLLGLLAVVNLFIMAGLMIIETNNHQEEIIDKNFTGMIIFLIILSFATIISLPIRLSIKNNDLITRKADY